MISKDVTHSHMPKVFDSLALAFLSASSRRDVMKRFQLKRFVICSVICDLFSEHRTIAWAVRHTAA